ncbi:gliding motility-associated C-terminal domain-containing protein [Membranihabitans maritimus]|uniref:T9SS type B sorting domain-containing protein n=1 Tax=Membranihabitans maritimus TaxID=2904244 RepID=UPI001F48763C|nr:gliding motility-associated C-terminal domain-containing protein [Membranihabitans maritimus]
MARIFLWMMVFSPLCVHTQDIYLGTLNELYRMDIETCVTNILPYTPTNAQRRDLLHDLAFHPNGKLYGATTQDLIEIDLVSNKVILLQSWNESDAKYAGIAINENGDFLVSEFGNSILKYDVRGNVFFEEIELNEGIYLFWDFYTNDDIISRDGNLDNNRRFVTTVNLYNNGIDTLMEFNESIGYQVGPISKFYNLCGNPFYIGQALGLKDPQAIHPGFMLRINFENDSFEELCTNNEMETILGTASTDDFRQNGYLVDLDGDNSSGHMTGGNYDTLTRCNPAGRIADDDISYRLCGEDIDYISFRIKYADEFAVPFEEITGSESLERTGPHRWEWRNPYGNDTEKISEFLRSVRYRADWPEENGYERTIVTTTHIGDDSTSSWSVLQLSGEVSRAGRDTTVSYCSTKGFINLRQYLSPMANKTDGYFEPELSAGGLFEPGKDPDGEYLYIVDKEGCRDTAVLTVSRKSEYDLDLRRYKVCRGKGASGPVKLPGKNYDSILWWNGETGYSTVIRPDDHGVLWVEAVKDGCTYRDTLSVYSVLGGGVAFDEKFADTVFICSSEETEIQVRSLDSIYVNGQVYYGGEYIPFLSPGVYELTGHKFDCVVSKEITVLRLEEESDLYSNSYPWCEGSSLKLELPDKEGVEFNWLDGYADSVREIGAYGEYPFMIQKGNCQAEAKYTVVPDDDCGGGCRIVIPNAVSPNGDGMNDDLDLIVKECGDFGSLTLFDKWGSEMYHSNESRVPAAVWDRLPVGVYLVRVSYQDNAGNVKVEAGSVFLLR